MSSFSSKSPPIRGPLYLLIPTDGGKQEKFPIDLIYTGLDQDRINEIVKLAADQHRFTYRRGSAGAGR